MKEQVLMPQLGESVTEGTVIRWFVKPGDAVNKYDPVCEIATDKVTAEVPSTVAGVIADICVSEGETVPVGTVICSIQTEVAEVPSTETVGDEEVPAAGLADSAEAAVGHGTEPIAGAGEAKALPAGEKRRYSPAVRKLAASHGVDLSRVKGTGAGGRITRRDVLYALEHKDALLSQASARTDAHAGGAATVEEARPTVQSGVATSVSAQPTAPSVRKVPAADPEDQIIPVTSIRRTIANRMVQSKREAPHAWLMVECDVTNLVRFRNRIKGEFQQKEGVPLTYLPFMVKAVVESLKQYPQLNAQWAEDNIVIKKAIHMSIAVATDDALFVPVIRNADQLSILGLAKSIHELAHKTRAGKLSMDELTGGTFTITNTGSFGAVMSAPIINQPQVAILSVESIVKRPVVIDNEMIAIRDMMNICLSLDHRVLDGLVCGRFLQDVKRRIEAYGDHTTIY